MRPVTHHKLAATVLLAAALAVAGCSAAPATGAGAAGAASAPPGTTTAPPATKAPPATTTAPAPEAAPAALRCTLAPASGQAGSTTTIDCTGFRPGERVTVGYEAVVIATARAGADGVLSTRLQVPDGFAGSHYPGRHDTFKATGRLSGRSARATFTVTG